LHRGLGNVLELRQKQNSLTAGNLANVDTPNYHAKYIRFDEILQDAVGTNDFGLATSNSKHINGSQGSVADPEIEEISPAPWVLDNNSVNLEKELVRLKENSLMFRSVTKGLTKRLSMLKYAASNGKGG
jgi:flagellar basal-body rod protein FlgB